MELFGPIPVEPMNLVLRTQTSSMSGPPLDKMHHALRSLALGQGRASRIDFWKGPACSWHAFLRTQIDPGNRNQRVAQTSPDVCVPQAQD